MTKIVIASANPVKIEAVIKGFQRMFPDMVIDLFTLSVSSGVSHQPMTDEETFTGAYNRASNARKVNPVSDYWIGIEGGIQKIKDELAAFAWIVILSKDLIGKGRTGTFFLPKAVTDLISQGKELGEADDIVFKRSNSKQENGAVGLLTNDVINRIQLYEQAVILALIPFKNKKMYF